MPHKKAKFYLLTLLQVASLSSAFAEQDAPNLQTHWNKPKWIREESRWRIFGSGLVGYGATPGKEYLHVPDGDQYLVSGVVSYQMPNWVHDMGLGWMSSNLRTKNADGGQLTISTKAAVAQYGVRYRLGKRWQIGPEFNLAFGTDTSFKPSIGPNSVTPFIGARFVYEMPVSVFPLRFLTQGLTDMGLDGRRAVLVMAGVEFGIPVGLPKYSQDTGLKMNAGATNSQQVRIQLDPKLIHFYTASSQVTPDAQEFLSDLAKILNANKENWNEVEIAGHADQRGTKEKNLNLSKKRARRIASILKSEGFNDERLTVTGFGYEKPLDSSMTREAWAKNRRVELVIDGVKDVDLIKEKLQAFQDQLRDRIWERKSK